MTIASALRAYRRSEAALRAALGDPAATIESMAAAAQRMRDAEAVYLASYEADRAKS